MKTLPSERGQAIVLIVIAIIGLFGAAALAIDLGQVYSARRSAQNAADAAALAAAYEASAGSKDADTAVQKAYSIALTNGYNNDEESNWVRVENGAFTDGPYCRSCAEGQVDDPYEYYEAQITVRLQPIFAQLIFNGMEQVTVNAIAHAASAEDASSGNAILSLSEDGDSMDFNGNVDVTVNGGSIRSNGGMSKTGASGVITVDPTNGGVWYAKPPAPKKDGPFTKNGGAKPFQQVGARMKSIKEPACTEPDTATTVLDPKDKKGQTVLYSYQEDPATGVTTYYYNNGLTQNDLPRGIHCVKGGIGKGVYTGKGVLIVLLSGDVQQTGGDYFDFSAATDMKDVDGNQWGGMVFYAPATNTNVLKFGGNSLGYFQGVVYAPGATCDFGGNPADTGLHTAIICNRFRDHGTGKLTIEYVPEEQFHFPPMVELVQ